MIEIVLITIIATVVGLFLLEKVIHIIKYHIAKYKEALVHSIKEEMAVKESTLIIPETKAPDITVSIEKAKAKPLLEDLPLKTVVQEWLQTIENINQRAIYSSLIDEMYKANILPSFFPNGEPFTIRAFYAISKVSLIGIIRSPNAWTENKKQEIETCYEVFHRHLNKISDGRLNRSALHGSAYEGPQISPLMVLRALTLEEWNRFIHLLHKMSIQDSLIARLLVKSGHKPSSILSLELRDIHYDSQFILLRRTRGSQLKDRINCDTVFMEELKKYIYFSNHLRKNSPLVFFTRHGKLYPNNSLAYSLRTASKTAKVQCVTAETLRATGTLLKRQGYSEDILTKVSK